MPSKLLGMMASEKPSLVLGNSESEVKQVMELANAGCYLTTPDVEMAVNQLEEWRLNKDKALIIGKDARTYVTQNFARKPILDNWVKKLNALL